MSPNRFKSGCPLAVFDQFRKFGDDANASPTTSRSENSAIGAAASLLIATIVPDARMPTLCWIAPEMPTAMYSFGVTVFPVCPIWRLYGTQPASAAARDAPTAPPSASRERLQQRVEGFRSAEPSPAGNDDRRFLECQLARAFLDVALDLGGHTLSGRLFERHDLRARAAGRRRKRVRADGRDAVIRRPQRARGDERAAELRRDADRPRRPSTCTSTTSATMPALEPHHQPPGDVASRERVRNQNQRRAGAPSRPRRDNRRPGRAETRRRRDLR